MFKNTIIVYLIYRRDMGNEMKQLRKEIFDFFGVKVAYTSKYGHLKTNRRMVGLFLALLQIKDTGFNNQTHCILHCYSQNNTYKQSTQQQLQEFLWLWKIPHTTSAFRMLNVLLCNHCAQHSTNSKWNPDSSCRTVFSSEGEPIRSLHADLFILTVTALGFF